ncbi:MAG TPA: SDR family oxidoreductase [Thermoleophilaceae bacterium]|nr:SDR family oxidoreductase [Thermoleophilaceae bacterium]
MAGGRVLVTGFPGFIGRRLVRALAEEDGDARITCLVESRMEAAARQAAADIDAERVEVLAGDIADRRLGLPDRDYERLIAETATVHHLAAIYDLAVPLEVAQRVNVDGTGNVLELCERCERLERLVYVSTAYVAGTRRGVVYEHELALGQGFKNHYESTKFQAELWARHAMDRVPMTILRPAIVVGDSRTGETQKFDGPYYMLRVVQTSEQSGGPIPQFGRSLAPFNVVPVDFVIQAMIAAGRDPEASGRTLHLVDPEPISSREVLELLAREYAGRGPSLRVPPRAVAASLRIPAVRRLYGGAPRESLRYLNHRVRFDTRQAGDLLERHGLRCPRFEEYVKPIVRYFRDHQDDPAYMSNPDRLRG